MIGGLTMVTAPVCTVVLMPATACCRLCWIAGAVDVPRGALRLEVAGECRRWVSLRVERMRRGVVAAGARVASGVGVVSRRASTVLCWARTPWCVVGGGKF